MSKIGLSLAVLLGLSFYTSAAVVQDALTAIEPEEARRVAEKLSDEAAEIEKPQVVVEADPDKAMGLHRPGRAGILIVPQKDLKEDEELAAKFKTERGAPLAQLFSYRIVPVIEGDFVDSSKLRTVNFTDDDGTDHPINLLLLAVRQVAEDDYRLHVYGQGEEPLVDVKFSQGAGTGHEPVAIQITDVQEGQGTLVVTVFDKYQASFRVGYKPA